MCKHDDNAFLHFFQVIDKDIKPDRSQGLSPVVPHLSQAFTLGKIILTVPSDLLVLNVAGNVLEEDSCHEFPWLTSLQFSGLNC